MIENNVNVDKFEKKRAVVKYLFPKGLSGSLAKRFMMICLLHWATMPLHTV